MCTLGERRRTLSKSLFYFENRRPNEQYAQRCLDYDSRLDKELLPEELDIDPVRNAIPQLIVLCLYKILPRNRNSKGAIFQCMNIQF